MVTVIVGVGVVVVIGRVGVDSGVRVLVNHGLIVEIGVRMGVVAEVGVVVGVGDTVRRSVGMMGVRFGWTVPVLLGLGKPEVLVGVEVELC